MLFTSYEFLECLTLLFLLYYILPARWQWKLLFAAGFLFYFNADPVYCVYILATILTTWFAGCRIRAAQEERDRWLQENRESAGREERKSYKAGVKRRTWIWALCCLLLNLSILAAVKYTNFAIANVNALLEVFGGGKPLDFIDIIVPLGISFYTFQSAGYIIDVYRETAEAERNPFKLALFVSFFPQLIQGPIGRFGELRKTLFDAHPFDKKVFCLGLERILWGFFKKLVIADRILAGVNTLIRDPDAYQGAYVFVGMLFYALELYADFTGGIDITIGIAQALGIRMAENFNRPYFSKNIKEYWKRWHITMGAWFTDYIFYPISVCKGMLKLSKFSRSHFGEAVGKRIPVYLSSFAVWFATGIWHGASWNFIAWGLGNWLVIMVSQELDPLYEKFHGRFRVRGRAFFRFFQVVRTILLMSCLRLFDCYRDVPLTFRMFGSMFSRWNWDILWNGALLDIGLSAADYLVLLAGLFLLTAVSLLQRKGSVRERIASLPYWGRFALWYGLFLAVLLMGAYGVGYDASQFIYNRF